MVCIVMYWTMLEIHEKNDYLKLFIKRTFELFEAYIKHSQNISNTVDASRSIEYFIQFQQLKQISESFDFDNVKNSNTDYFDKRKSELTTSAISKVNKYI